MKAIIVNHNEVNSVRISDLPKPSPIKEQVLLKILCVGIDGTDQEINNGVYGQPPVKKNFLVIGHESLARIAKLGKNVKNLSIGDLVVPTVRRPCPENCANCKIGEISMCLTGNYLEHGIIKLHGFASEFALCDSRFIIKVPEELKKTAVLLEPLSVAEKAISQIFQIQERLNWKPKRSFVIGAGPLGLLISILLRLRGIEVFCMATQPVTSLKAKIIQSIEGSYYDANKNPIQSFPGDFDIVVEATGNVNVAINSLSLLNSNGVLCFLGVYPDKKACQDFGKVLTSMVLGNRVIFGSVSSDKIHFKMGINDMIKIKSTYKNLLEKLITQKLSLKEFSKAFSKEKSDIKSVIYFKQSDF